MSKSVVIYAAGSQLTPGHQCIAQTPFPIWARVETHDADYDEALNRAKPMVGETVLNSIDNTCYLPADVSSAGEFSSWYDENVAVGRTINQMRAVLGFEPIGPEGDVVPRPAESLSLTLIPGGKDGAA